MNDQEHMSDELRQFEAELRSLKPRAAGCVCAVRLPKPRQKRNILLALGGVLAVPVALLLLVGVALRSPVVEQVPSPVEPIPVAQIAQTPPEKTSQDRWLAMRSRDDDRMLNVRRQTALMFEEMRLNETAEPVRSQKTDYPVMVITVDTAPRPMSPEAKQAFQRRLRGELFLSIDDADGRRYL